MLEGFISLITSRLAGPVLGGFLVLSVVGNAYQGISHHFEVKGLHDQISTLSKANDRLTRDNATLKVNQATLEAAVTSQNAQVDAYKQAADLADARAKAAQAGFNAAADALDKQAKASSKLPPLPAGADHCAAASKLIRDRLASEHRQ